jgi:hypothetical protein
MSDLDISDMRDPMYSDMVAMGWRVLVQGGVCGGGERRDRERERESERETATSEAHTRLQLGNSHIFDLLHHRTRTRYHTIASTCTHRTPHAAHRTPPHRTAPHLP